MRRLLAHLFATESKPFIKWAGGKRGLLDSLLPFVPKEFGDYFEPFLGGGALFFALKNRGLLEAKNVYLNDKNTELMNAYWAIQNHTHELLNELEILQQNHNRETFYFIRNLDRQVDFLHLKDYFRAARFIYLNKTCFNGLCRYNSNGEFNTPMGSYKNPKIYDRDLVLSANNALEDVQIMNLDFEQAVINAKRGDFVYFDPPYYPLNKTSSFVSYTDNFLEEEQKRLYGVFVELNTKGVKVLQSNSNAEFIRKLYRDFECIELRAKRVINCKGDKRGEITELLIRGDYE